MADAGEATGQRDRSPAYPIIPIGPALERLAQFEAHFKRSAARPEKIGDAWTIKAKAHADRIAAALRYFGLLEYQVSGGMRSVVISDLGRNYLRAQQEETKREIVATVALKPKQIAIFWNEWGADRPADAACLDELVLKKGFSEAGARDFLKVYDATIAYAKPPQDAKVMQHQVIEDEDEPKADPDLGIVKVLNTPTDRVPLVPGGKVKIMDGERIAFTEEGHPGQYLKLIASGEVDDGLLEALEDYVKRQRKRLQTWYSLVFAGDQAEQSVVHFASAMKSAWEAAGLPHGCEAYRNQGDNGVQTILLNPPAASLALQMPPYKPLLDSTVPPFDLKNVPGLKPMGIFK